MRYYGITCVTSSPYQLARRNAWRSVAEMLRRHKTCGRQAWWRPWLEKSGFQWETWTNCMKRGKNTKFAAILRKKTFVKEDENEKEELGKQPFLSRKVFVKNKRKKRPNQWEISQTRLWAPCMSNMHLTQAYPSGLKLKLNRKLENFTSEEQFEQRESINKSTNNVFMRKIGK